MNIFARLYESEDEALLRRIRKQASKKDYWEKPAPWMYRMGYSPAALAWVQEARWLAWQAQSVWDAMHDWDQRFELWKHEQRWNGISTSTTTR